MLLSDRGIAKRIDDGDLHFDPALDPERQIQPASIDVRLGYEFHEFDFDDDVRFDPSTDDAEEYGRPVECEAGDSYELEPGAFVLGTTLETVDFPDDLAGVLIGRSSFGRLGVVPYTGAGFVDPGFTGQLTLEFANHGPFTVVLTPGETCVVQLYVLTLASSSDTPYGDREDSKYQGQAGPAGSRIGSDWTDEA